LIPMLKDKISIPLIAAGGIGSGRGMLAAMALGADGVQIGSRFVASEEASSHISFKNEVVKAGEGATKLTLKELAPVRMMKNKFYQQVEELTNKPHTPDDLRKLLGKGRTKLGMFDGDLDEGELEIGQVAGLIRDIKPVKQIIDEIVFEFNEVKENW